MLLSLLGQQLKSLDSYILYDVLCYDERFFYAFLSNHAGRNAAHRLPLRRRNFLFHDQGETTTNATHQVSYLALSATSRAIHLYPLNRRLGQPKLITSKFYSKSEGVDLKKLGARFVSLQIRGRYLITETVKVRNRVETRQVRVFNLLHPLPAQRKGDEERKEF